MTARKEAIELAAKLANEGGASTGSSYYWHVDHYSMNGYFAAFADYIDAHPPEDANWPDPLMVRAREIAVRFFHKNDHADLLAGKMDSNGLVVGILAGLKEPRP